MYNFADPFPLFWYAEGFQPSHGAGEGLQASLALLLPGWEKRLGDEDRLKVACYVQERFCRVFIEIFYGLGLLMLLSSLLRSPLERSSKFCLL